jgi:photosystem II stability/assembly factor-like uncharacterized protein
MMEDDYIVDLALKESGRMALLTSRGTLFYTDNARRKWHRIDAMREEEQPELVWSRLITGQRGRLWILGGTGGIEGTWSVLAREQGEREWQRFVLEGFCLVEGVVTSEGGLIVGGFVAAQNVEEWLREGSRGVILYSSDGGKQWDYIHSDERAKRVNRVVVVGSDVWAVGDAGMLVKITIG